MVDLNTTGARMRLLRQYRNLNQTQLVARLEERGVYIGRSYISELERTDRTPSTDVIIALAQVLGTTTDYLLLRTDNPDHPGDVDDAFIGSGEGQSPPITDLVVTMARMTELTRAPRKVRQELCMVINDFLDSWGVPRLGEDWRRPADVSEVETESKDVGAAVKRDGV